MTTWRGGTALANHDLVVIGASAGGVDALIKLVHELPADLAAPVLVVLHLPPDGRSNLPQILDRAGPLPAEVAVDGTELQPGRILCAPPDHHLAVRDGRAVVVRGPHENLHRPSVDVLFRSAAMSRDGRTCAVVLSGALDDGTSGMRAVRAGGGLTVVQDPADALVPSMPASVIQVMEPDFVLAADEIGRRLPELLALPRRHEAPESEHSHDDLAQEVAMSTLAPGAHDHDPPGSPSGYGCPECGGVLWEVKDGDDLRFRCRVGHAYTARALLADEDAQLEDALWAALRALEEQESLTRRMLDRNWAHGTDRTRDRLRERMEHARGRADVLRDFLLAQNGNGAEATAVGTPSREEATAG